jgi:hypothetical protein
MNQIDRSYNKGINDCIEIVRNNLNSLQDLDKCINLMEKKIIVKRFKFVEYNSTNENRNHNIIVEKKPINRSLLISTERYEKFNRNQKKNYIKTLLDEGVYSDKRSKQYGEKRILWKIPRNEVIEKYSISRNFENTIKEEFNKGVFNVEFNHKKIIDSKTNILITESILQFLESKDPEPWPFAIKKNAEKLLASNNSVKSLYWEYHNNQLISGGVTCSWSTFLGRFNKSGVAIVPQLSDICNACKNYYIKKRSGECGDDDKEIFQAHCDESRKRRLVYKFFRMINQNENESEWNKLIDELNKISSVDMFGADENIKVLSFDYKQNISLPYNPLQANALYYASKKVINVFGIFDEDKNTQAIHLYDETVGKKTASEISSMLYDELVKMDLQNHHLVLFADNCGGQNKNSYLVFFLMWLVLKKFVKSVRLCFMVVGHTHFSPDRGFGLLSKKLKTCNLETPDDVRNGCSIGGVIEKVKLHDSLSDWKKFLIPSFVHLKSIKYKAELLITSESPGFVYSNDTLIPSKLPKTSEYSDSEYIFNDLPLPDLKELITIEKSDTSDSKKKSLRELYKKGLVAKENFEYYFSNENEYSTK